VLHAPCPQAQGPVLYRNMILNDEEFSGSYTTLKLGHHPMSAAVTSYVPLSTVRLLSPQPGEAPCRADLNQASLC